MLSEMPKTKCANHGKTCKWPELEETMTEWVNQQRSSGFFVTRPTIRLHTLKWAEKYRKLSVDFKATTGCVLGLCRDIILHFEEFDGF